MLDKLADAQVQVGNLSGIHRQFDCDANSQAFVFDDRSRPSRRLTREVARRCRDAGSRSFETPLIHRSHLVVGRFVGGPVDVQPR